jgi:phenylacetate-CoA ligase
VGWGVKLESLYLRLPIPCQNWAIGVEGWRLQRRRYGRAYIESATAAHLRESLSEPDLQAYRSERLTQHLVAAAHTTFWRRRFAEFDVDPRSTDPFSALSQLPVLSKLEVKAYIDEFRNPALDTGDLLSVHTSGTTGAGLIFQQTREMERVTWATWWRYREWHGLNQNHWCAYFGGRSVVPLTQQVPPFWRWNRPGRQLLFSGYHLSSRTAPDYAKALFEAQIDWVHGYPSMLALLSTLAIEQSLPLPKARIVTTGAENLLPSQRSAISAAFQAPVLQHYGQAEGVANISQCPSGALHVDEDYAGVEFLPLEGMPGSFRIIGTNWYNPAFPLLRYDTGDVATLDANDTCPCGRHGRIVRAIDGRLEDYVVLSSGAKVGRMDHVFKDMVNVREAQIVQCGDGQIVVRLARGTHYAASDETMLLDELTKRLGHDSRISIQYVDSIPRTKSGKFRLVVKE